jgi:hypothetical protein
MNNTKQYLVYVEYGGDMECWELCNGYYTIVEVPKGSIELTIVQEWARLNGVNWSKISFDDYKKCYADWGRPIKFIELKENFKDNKRQQLQWIECNK